MLPTRDVYACPIKQTKPNGGRDADGNPVLHDVPFLVVDVLTVKEKKTGAETRWLVGWVFDPLWLEQPDHKDAVPPRRMKLPHGEGVNQACDVWREAKEARAAHAAAERKAKDLEALAAERQIEINTRVDEVRAQGAKLEARDAELAAAAKALEDAKVERDELLKDAGEHVKALQARVAELEAKTERNLFLGANGLAPGDVE